MTDIRDAWRAFATTVGLITTHGSKGPNVMAAEWTFHVSYRPFLIAVHLSRETATHDAIVSTKAFGVNLASEDQVAQLRFAGHFSKWDTDKLTSGLFETYPGRRIDVPMLKGAVLNAECRLVQQAEIGDHTMFVGEVVAFEVDPTKRPAILHRGPHRIGERIGPEPGIAVAATPMSAAPGSDVVVAGEFMGADRSPRTVEILVESGAGQLIARATTESDGRYFSASIRVPEAAKAGPYRVLVRAGSLEGHARIVVA